MVKPQYTFKRWKRIKKRLTHPYLGPVYGPARPSSMNIVGGNYTRALIKSTKFFPDLFPEKKRVRVVYADTIKLDAAGAGQIAVNAFRCNSVFDPDWTGVGHQPKYHDTLAAIYERYAVESAKIEVQFFTGTSTATDQRCAGFLTQRPTSGDQISVTLDTYTRLLENGSCKFSPMGMRDGGHDISKKLTMTYSPEAMYGGPAINEDDNQAVFGANPSKSPLWWAGVVPIHSGDQLTDVYMTVKITYNVCCFRKKHDLVED